MSTGRSHVDEAAQLVLDSASRGWAGSSSAGSLRGLVEHLRTANDSKKKHLAEMQHEVDSMRKVADDMSRRSEGRPDDASFGANAIQNDPWLRGLGAQTPLSLSPPGTDRRYRPSPGRVGAELAARDPDAPRRVQAWDAALWACLEHEEAAWEDGSAQACPRLAVEDPQRQQCELAVLALTDTFREVVRRLEGAQADSRFGVIRDIAQQSEDFCIRDLSHEIAARWAEWRDAQLEAERTLFEVNEEVEELRRRLGPLEGEERELHEQLSRLRATRMVPKEQLSLLEVDLAKARQASGQHEQEFDARSREQETKIAATQQTIEQLTRELSIVRQRNYEEEALTRQEHIKQVEMTNLRVQELHQYRKDVMPLLHQYNAIHRSEATAASVRMAKLRELSDRHRQELLDLAAADRGPKDPAAIDLG